MSKREQPLTPDAESTISLASEEVAASVVQTLCSILQQRSCEREPAGLPFSELLQPLLHHAAKSIEPFAASHSWLAGALPGLKAQLLRRLWTVARLPLYLWFHLHQRPNESSGYQRFLSSMSSDAPSASTGSNDPSWSGLFSEYPELARLLDLIVVEWRAASTEFLARLVADSPRLAQFLLLPSLQVESVIAGLSDPHNQGRSVIRVKFSGEKGLAYKPRPLGAEAAFFRLLAQIAAQEPELRLPAAQVVTRDGYGWMAWIDPSPASSSNDWYTRAGMLQFLLQVFGISDAHMANCVATAEAPSLVDCECMLMPTAHVFNTSGSQDDALETFVAEIESTGFLPRLSRSSSEPDLSGLFGCGGQPVEFRIPIFTTTPDGCDLSFKAAILRPQRNLISNGSPSITKMAAGKSFLSGFERMYIHFVRHREPLRATLAALQPIPSRILLRNTRRYVEILSQSIHPRFLRSRKDRRAFVASSLRADLPSLSTAAAPEILEAELDALDCLNVPYFHAVGRDLYAGDAMIQAEFLAAVGRDVVLERLLRLDPAKLIQYKQVLQLLWLNSVLGGEPVATAAAHHAS